MNRVKQKRGISDPCIINRCLFEIPLWVLRSRYILFKFVWKFILYKGFDEQVLTLVRYII